MYVSKFYLFQLFIVLFEIAGTEKKKGKTYGTRIILSLARKTI